MIIVHCSLFIAHCSLRKHSTGFTRAALNACTPTVSHAIDIAEQPAPKKYHTSMGTRYAKLSSQCFIIKKLIGKAITIATRTIFVKSKESKYTMDKLLDPNTFLIPISFNRRSAVKDANANNPRHDITIAIPAKYCDKVATLCSEA